MGEAVYVAPQGAQLQNPCPCDLWNKGFLSFLILRIETACGTSVSKVSGGRPSQVK